MIDIKEYRTEEFENFQMTDWNYLEKPCFGYNEDKEKNPFVIFINKKNKVCIRNTSYAGVIQLPSGLRINFSTKVDAHLFYMLRYLKSERAFLVDIDKPIDIEAGLNFFDIIGGLFLNELNMIIGRGLLKKSTKKHENLSYLKGRLNVKGQFQNYIRATPKFACTYNTLTVNNLENQIVLKALNLLIPIIRFNKGVREGLIRYEYILKDHIKLVDVSPNDCEKIHFNTQNEYYRTIIKFSKLILEESFIRSTQKGGSIGFNFLVNMIDAYEDFLSEITREVVNEDFGDFLTLTQKVRSLSSIVIRPDIFLEKKDTHIIDIVIDFKYKKEDKNIDYYQVIAYGLAIPTARACCLIFPKSQKSIRKHEVLIPRDVTDKNSDTINIYARQIDLLMEDTNYTLQYEDYIKNIKNQIKDIIHDCIGKEIEIIGDGNAAVIDDEKLNVLYDRYNKYVPLVQNILPKLKNMISFSKEIKFTFEDVSKYIGIDNKNHKEIYVILKIILFKEGISVNEGILKDDDIKGLPYIIRKEGIKGLIMKELSPGEKLDIEDIEIVNKMKRKRYPEYAKAISDELLPTIKKGIAESKDGMVRIKINDVTKSLGEDFISKSQTTIYWGLKYVLFFEEIVVNTGTTKTGEKIFIFRNKKPGEVLPPSFEEGYRIL